MIGNHKFQAIRKNDEENSRMREDPRESRLTGNKRTSELKAVW